MFYIFNSNNVCIASCSFEPNMEDLDSRKEFCIESESIANLGDTYVDGIITKSKVEQAVDYKNKARAFRNTLRDKIDDYIKPASTINDERVTEEQKSLLINDSVLLARWPTCEGWPSIALPALSELSVTLLNNPIWIYPIGGSADGN